MFGRKKHQIIDLTPKEAEHAAKTGELVLVDVREADERRQLAPKVKSMHIPVGGIADRTGELPTDRPVAFVCKAGGRSMKAAKTAATAGLDVRNVVGGMTAWDAQGLPTKKGSA
ncbi:MULTISPECIES: rhodanese-like domain-containing protein [Patulibacter]|jgi:rhodanese-related sulfurtransferase|uniref:Unannotated protein n=1 Tax=freshwater metagenome TaxID=449393 RepID=A0A6J7KZ28_9ZZZZ|nr:rhodanese-like domain-containing protein [Patulibacter minatonensis]MSW53317.1 rhodanese-like domain-containing protein [Actinomycetota bacterium]